MNIFIPYLHYISIMILMGALFSEYVLLKADLSKERIKSLAVVDVIYGISAGLVIISGLLRWFMIDPKGPEYFNTQPLFHIKLTLFVVVVILSIFPTLKFLKWKKQVNADETFSPGEKEIKKLVLFVRIEVFLMLLIPLLAVFVAQNVRM